MGGATVGRRAGAAAMAGAAAVLALGASAPARDTAACASAHAMPSAAASAERSERALLCLLNRARARAGARALRLDRCLDRAAERHARDLVRRRYFAHDSLDGRSVGDRARAAGYLPAGAHWMVGENLAWGAAPAGDPAWTVHAWLRSPSHRANVLRHAFRDVGIAAIPGAPVTASGRPRATYAVDFGVHDGRAPRCHHPS